MKQLAKGILVGSLATVAAIASGVLTFHKTVIKPAEEEEEKFPSTYVLGFKFSRQGQ